MTVKNIAPRESISLFVKNIILIDEENSGQDSVLPFYADGYPGLMFQQTTNGLFVQPHNKQMPDFFLYGQTIQPIELLVSGACRFIVFQLFPFVLKSLFNLSPKDLNDDCYDLIRLANIDVAAIIQQLKQTIETAARIDTMGSFLLTASSLSPALLDFKIRQAILLIINNSGQISMQTVCETLKITERTFERRFLAQTGVSPKQFGTIIQFSGSLNMLNAKEYSKLTDIVYANGFADQSHFIRVFKTFTGTTPGKFNQ